MHRPMTMPDAATGRPPLTRADRARYHELYQLRLADREDLPTDQVPEFVRATLDALAVVALLDALDAADARIAELEIKLEARDAIIAAGARTIASGDAALTTLRAQWAADREKLQAEIAKLKISPTPGTEAP